EAINQILPVVNILPIASKKQGRRIYANEVLIPAGTAGLKKESIIFCFQMRTLDKKRLGKEIGKIDQIALQETITDALCFQLGIVR
ncbi:MAG: type II toxin-antitoxin system PemK/MazF family toxin, partial [Candidatus Omnitrophica bacterium]|nr:type II toxin-antitoxin system PemK/MazF family toxin [Candidatus Omnitrophota bacterium]